MTINEYLAAEKAKKEARANDLNARLAEIAKRADELKDINEKSNCEKELKDANAELDKLLAEKAEKEAELEGTKAEIAELEKQIADLQEKPADDPQPDPDAEGQRMAARGAFLNFNTNQTQPEKRGGQKTMTLEERQARADALVKNNVIKLSLKEARAITVVSGDIATPTGVDGINDTMDHVSMLYDLVKKVNCVGMGSNKVAYEKNIGEAYDQVEGQTVEESDPEYDFVTITPNDIMGISSLSNQVRKQSPLDYEGKVIDSADKALKVKLNKYITSAIVNSDLLAKPAALKIAEIDNKTLRNIALNYGSDSAIYGDCWLFLTHKDLVAFGDIYSDLTMQPVYEITPDTKNPNTGIIKAGGLSVRYCLNKHLTALADATENAVTMFYGQVENCELDLFDDIEVKVSEDFKFGSNMLTIRGTASAGAAITKKDGFIAVTKAAQ